MTASCSARLTPEPSSACDRSSKASRHGPRGVCCAVRACGGARGWRTAPRRSPCSGPPAPLHRGPWVQRQVAQLRHVGQLAQVRQREAREAQRGKVGELPDGPARRRRAGSSQTCSAGSLARAALGVPYAQPHRNSSTGRSCGSPMLRTTSVSTSDSWASSASGRAPCTRRQHGRLSSQARNLLGRSQHTERSRCAGCTWRRSP
jgi:hypothetical protein